MDDLCVVVVSHNSKRWLDAALSSLWAHRGELEPDVVVVDNGSDGAADYVEARFPFARTLRCENRGFAHANNAALPTSDSRYVLFLNPDTEVLGGTLSDLVRAMDELPAAGLAGARQLRPDGSLAPTIRRFPSALNTLAEALGSERMPALNRRLGERLLDPRAYDRRTSCDWTSGSFMLARRAALDAVGYLDDRFFLFSEETDLCWRLRRAGWEVLHLPEVTIRHEESDGFADPRLVSQNTYSRLQFAEKNFSPLHRRLDRMALWLRYGLRLALYAGAQDDRGRREAARASLRTLLREEAPFAQATGSAGVDEGKHVTPA